MNTKSELAQRLSRASSQPRRGQNAKGEELRGGTE